MSSSTPWRSELTFSDRMKFILAMHVISSHANMLLRQLIFQPPYDSTEAYRSAFPEISASQAQAKARSTEAGILARASSLDDYDLLADEYIENLDTLAIAQETNKTLNADEGAAQGQQIGPYSNAIYHQSGIFSTIYKAKSPDGSLLALKLTTPSQTAPPHNPLREARILKRTSHPSIIPLLSAASLDDGMYLLVFPFYPLSLESLLQKHIHPSQPSLKSVSYLRDIFSGLAHIHSLGIIHRDVKPSNILLASPVGPAYLADFGIAWMPGVEATEPSDQKITDVGTTSYRPPEILFGYSSYGCSLDLWAAGCVVAEVFTKPRKTLFDSGALGSELALIQSIFKVLGTPTPDMWPESSKFSSWGKMDFHFYNPQPWSEILPHAPEAVRDLISKLIRYESSERLDANAALSHPFFREGSRPNAKGGQRGN